MFFRDLEQRRTRGGFPDNAPPENSAQSLVFTPSARQKPQNSTSARSAERFGLKALVHGPGRAKTPARKPFPTSVGLPKRYHQLLRPSLTLETSRVTSILILS